MSGMDDSMDGVTGAGWTVLTNHGKALVCIAHDPDIRLRDLGDRLGITERAAHRIVTDLDASGYITREKTGRRNRYTINPDLTLPDTVAHEQKIGRLLEVLTEKRRARVPGQTGRSRWPTTNGHRRSEDAALVDEGAPGSDASA